MTSYYVRNAVRNVSSHDFGNLKKNSTENYSEFGQSTPCDLSDEFVGSVEKILHELATYTR